MSDDGLVDFIQKPFTMESLAGVLQKLPQEEAPLGYRLI